MKEYILYKGEEILATGTMFQIAEEMGVKYRTIMYYGTPSQRIRTKGRGRILIPIEGDSEGEIR